MRISVLIVEDLEPMRAIMRMVLKEMNIREIVEADNGLEALKIIEKRMQPSLEKDWSNKINNLPFDLVICDWNMPQMSGIELLQKIRANPKLKKLPFLMLTSETGEEHLTKAMQYGVSDYVIKPFQAKVLEKKIRALLTR